MNVDRPIPLMNRSASSFSLARDAFRSTDAHQSEFLQASSKSETQPPLSDAEHLSRLMLAPASRISGAEATVRQLSPAEQAETRAQQELYDTAMAESQAQSAAIATNNIAHLSNVADMDLEGARSEFRLVNYYADSGMLDPYEIHASNGDQTTSSLQEYLSWLHKRVEALEAEQKQL